MAARWNRAVPLGLAASTDFSAALIVPPFLLYREFSGGVIRVLTDVLGFFGGDALGVSQAWIVLPLAIVFALAAIGEIDRQKPGKPVHLLLLMLSAPVLMALVGFATPRSFLYLAPVVAALITMFFDRQLQQGHLQRAIAAVARHFCCCDRQSDFRNAPLQAEFSCTLPSHN
jgi:uncharacterized protein YggT (Ycf19 family)